MPDTPECKPRKKLLDRINGNERELAWIVKTILLGLMGWVLLSVHQMDSDLSSLQARLDSMCERLGTMKSDRDRLEDRVIELEREHRR